jgi:hypothetical protein
VGAEIVLHEHDLGGAAKVSAGQILEHLRVVQCGVAVGYLDMPPPRTFLFSTTIARAGHGRDRAQNGHRLLPFWCCVGAA